MNKYIPTKLDNLDNIDKIFKIFIIDKYKKCINEELKDIKIPKASV